MCDMTAQGVVGVDASVCPGRRCVLGRARGCHAIGPDSVTLAALSAGWWLECATPHSPCEPATDLGLEPVVRIALFEEHRASSWCSGAMHLRAVARFAGSLGPELVLVYVGAAFLC